MSSEASPYTREALEAAATATEQATLIYQARFFDGRWQGRADLLRRVSVPSLLGEHAYEVLDTKLARQSSRRKVVHQLSLYNRLLASVQGFEPALAHLVLGDGSTPATIDVRHTRRCIVT